MHTSSLKKSSTAVVIILAGKYMAKTRLRLLNGKSARFLHGLSQFIQHFIFAFVRRQIQSVETSVSFGQVIGRGFNQVQSEKAGTRGSRRALQRFETLQRNLEKKNIHLI